MNRDLTLALCDLQRAVQTACAAAKHAGDEATYHELRKLAWATASLLVNVAREHEVVA
jgi:hypothetical protein